MNLLIRADASVAMGTGHVMRCLALAQAWQDAGGTATFAAADITPAVRNRLSAESCDLVNLSCAAGSLEDATQTCNLARERGAAWIVVDGYQFTGEYQKAIKTAGCKLIFVDDYGHCNRYYADLVLNQNLNADERMYAAREPYTRLLLGTKFCLLRREFAKWRDWKREIPPVAHNVLVTMGGSDPDNVTDLALRAFSLLRSENIVCTVVTSCDHPARQLRWSVRGLNNTIEWRDSAPRIVELIARADLGIIAGGGTLWEFLYMSCPVLSFGRNSVQQNILTDLQAEGIVWYLGNPKEATAQAVASVIRRIATSAQDRDTMSRLGRCKVDGRGAARACELMLNRMGL